MCDYVAQMSPIACENLVSFCPDVDFGHLITIILQVVKGTTPAANFHVIHLGTLVKVASFVYKNYIPAIWPMLKFAGAITLTASCFLL